MGQGGVGHSRANVGHAGGLHNDIHQIRRGRHKTILCDGWRAVRYGLVRLDGAVHSADLVLRHPAGRVGITGVLQIHVGDDASPKSPHLGQLCHHTCAELACTDDADTNGRPLLPKPSKR